MTLQYPLHDSSSPNRTLDNYPISDEPNRQTISEVSCTKTDDPTSVRNRTKAAMAVVAYDSRR